MENPFRRGKEDVPRLFTIVAGRMPEQDPDLVDLVNRCFVDWAKVYWKVCPGSGKTCPYYTPASQMTAICSLFAYL